MRPPNSNLKRNLYKREPYELPALPEEPFEPYLSSGVIFLKNLEKLDPALPETLPEPDGNNPSKMKQFQNLCLEGVRNAISSRKAKKPTSRAAILDIGILFEKTGFLREEITKLEDHIEDRKSLVSKKSRVIAQEIANLNFELADKESLWRVPGQNSSMDAWRTDRERRVLSLKQQLWNLPEHALRDIVIWERDLRELLREYLSLRKISQGHYAIPDR